MIEFFVPGIPRPGGSKTAFVNKKTGKAILTDAGGKHTANWRSDVKQFALKVCQNAGAPWDGPLDLQAVFVFPRPKAHYGSGKNAQTLKPTAPKWHTSKPDATKLLRSLEDALKSIAWRDDSQVCVQAALKMYGSVPGASVSIKRMAHETTS